MKVSVYKVDREKVGVCELADKVFGVSPRPDILARVVRWQLAKRRQGTHASKKVHEVSGTTKKPHKQKGTGRARQGSLRSPQFRGGGVVFGPHMRSHGHKLPKKVRNLGLRSALSSKVLNGEFFVLDGFPEFQKTKECFEALQAWSCPVLVVNCVRDDLALGALARSARNLIGVNFLSVSGLNVYDILRHDCILFEQGALVDLEKRLCV